MLFIHKILERSLFQPTKLSLASCIVFTTLFNFMYPNIKSIFACFAMLCSSLAFAQATHSTTDIDANYKQAKTYFINEQYGLAYPIFKNIYFFGNDKSHYPNHVKTECAYYYLSCGLLMDDATCVDKSIDFIENEQNTVQVQLLSFQLASYYFREKNYTKAIQYYTTAGIANLDNAAIATSKFNKAYSYFALQKMEEAKPLFNSIRQIPSDPNYIDANYYYGFICFSEKNYKEALTSFLIAEKNSSYNKVVPFYIAEIYYFNNERDKALEYTLNQLKTPNQYYDVQFKQLAGKLYFDKRQFAKALPYLEEYYRKNDKVTRSDLYELSYCYYEAGNWLKSIEGFKQLGGKEDSLAQNSMYLLADAFLKTNQKQNARNAFLFCASNNSNPIQQEISAFSYAKLSYELGYTDIVLKELQQFIITYPNSKYQQEAKELLVAVLANTSNYADALTLFESLKTQSEGVKKLYPKILYGRSVELINDQQIVRADALLNKITTLPYNTNEMPFVSFWKGEIAYRQGILDLAITNLQQYLLNPKTNGEVNSTNAKYTLGYCLLKLEEYKQAELTFKEVATNISNTSSPLVQDAYIRLADCFFMQKQYKPAQKIYDDIIALNLKNADYALYQTGIIAGANNKNIDKIKWMKDLLVKYPNSTLNADANIEIANSFLADEKYEEALEPLKKVLNNNEAKALWPQGFLKNGIAYFNTDKNDESLSNFTKLVQQYPNSQESDEAIEYIRNIFIEKQQPDLFVNFMKSNGKNITTEETDSLTYRSAMLRYDAKDFENAKTGFTTYLNNFATGKYSVESNYFLAEINISKKDFNAALPYYNAVAARAPNKYAERSTLQSARIYYFDLKDFSKAQQYFAQLKTLATQQENKLEAMRGLLRCQYKLKLYKEGLANAMELLAENGTAIDDKMMANMIVAKGYQLDNKLQEATTAYTNLLSFGKNEFGAEAQYQIAAIAMAQDNFSAAEKAAFKVIKNFGSYEFWVTKSYLLLGDIYTKQKDWFNAEATYKSVAENTAIEELKKEAIEKLASVVEAKNAANKIINP